MASARKVLRPFRQTLTSIISSRSSIPPLRQFSHAKLESSKALWKDLEPAFRNRASTCHCYLNIQTNSLQKFWFSGGRKSRFGSILGVSVLFGSIIFFPKVSYAMYGHDTLVNDQNLKVLGASDVEENRAAMFLRKFWVPFIFFLTVLALWGDPVTTIAFRLILILLTTRPSPYSVYIFVDELCHRLKRREPHLYNKSLYAHKVEVEDFKLLCLATVELRDQKFTLVGILGGWWPLPTLNAFKDRLLYFSCGGALNKFRCPFLELLG